MTGVHGGHSKAHRLQLSSQLGPDGLDSEAGVTPVRVEQDQIGLTLALGQNGVVVGLAGNTLLVEGVGLVPITIE